MFDNKPKNSWFKPENSINYNSFFAGVGTVEFSTVTFTQKIYSLHKLFKKVIYKREKLLVRLPGAIHYRGAFKKNST